MRMYATEYKIGMNWLVCKATDENIIHAGYYEVYCTADKNLIPSI